MAIHRRAWGFLALLVGCGSPGSVRLEVPELPSKGGMGALLVEDEAGGLLGSTGLFELETDGRPTVVTLPEGSPSDGAEVWLLAFDRAPSGAEALDPSSLFEQRITHQRAGDPSLPPAEWSGMGTLVDGRARLAEARYDRLLTASWLSPCEPLLRDEVLVQPGCAEAYCEVQHDTEGCRLRILGEGCGLPDVVVDQREKVGLEATTSRGEACSLLSAPSWADMDLECPLADGSRCEWLVSAMPRPKLLDVEVKGISFLPPEPAVQYAALIGGLAVLDDRVVVSTFDGRLGDSYCRGGAEGRFAFLDLDTLDEVGTATSPPCTTFVHAEPEADTFIAVFNGTPPRVGRFDREGRLLVDASLEQDGVSLDGMLVRGLIGTPQGAIVVHLGPDTKRPPSRVLLLEPSTLRVSVVSEPLDLTVETAAVTDKAVALVDDQRDEIHLFSLETLAPVGSFSLIDALEQRLHDQVHWHEGSGQILIGVRSAKSPGITRTDQRQRLGRSVTLEAIFRPSALASWPPDRSLVLVGLDPPMDYPWPASVGLFDPGRGIFAPGLVELGGVGGLSFPAVDEARGTVWLAQAPSGRVVRVRASR